MARIPREVSEGSNGEPIRIDGETIVNPRDIGSTGEATGTFAAAEPAFPEGYGTVKRRGRPAGSKNKETRKAVPLDVNAVQFSLTGIHALLAVGLSAPRLAMGEKEAEVISKNLVAVSRHFDLQASAMAVDCTNLAISLAAFYGPAIYLTIKDKQAARATRRNSVQPVNVQPLSPNTAPAPKGARPNGAPLATHTPSNEERNALLDEPIIPMFSAH